jgi:hypothetical protein
MRVVSGTTGRNSSGNGKQSAFQHDSARGEEKKRGVLRHGHASSRYRKEDKQLMQIKNPA